MDITHMTDIDPIEPVEAPVADQKTLTLADVVDQALAPATQRHQGVLGVVGHSEIHVLLQSVRAAILAAAGYDEDNPPTLPVPRVEDPKAEARIAAGIPEKAVPVYPVAENDKQALLTDQKLSGLIPADATEPLIDSGHTHVVIEDPKTNIFA